MSESVNYKPTVTVGSTAGIAILTAAGAKATVAGASKLFRELMNSEKWISTCQREALLQESMQDNFEKLSKSHLSNSDIFNEAQEFYKIIAMTKALDSVSYLSAMMKAEHGQELKNVSNQCSDFIQKINSGTVTKDIKQTAHSLNTRLREITSDAHQKLANAEGSILRDIFSQSLKNNGYRVKEKMGALRATKGTTCIWTQIDQKARMSLDVSGFSGLSCQKEIRKLENELAIQGISLNRDSFELHGNKDGGDLAKKMSNFFKQNMANKSLKKDQKINLGNKNVTSKTKSTTIKRKRKQLKVRG